jgi:hypothetical protein
MLVYHAKGGLSAWEGLSVPCAMARLGLLSVHERRQNKLIHHRADTLGLPVLKTGGLKTGGWYWVFCLLGQNTVLSVWRTPTGIRRRQYGRP